MSLEVSDMYYVEDRVVQDIIWAAQEKIRKERRGFAQNYAYEIVLPLPYNISDRKELKRWVQRSYMVHCMELYTQSDVCMHAIQMLFDRLDPGVLSMALAASDKKLIEDSRTFHGMLQRLERVVDVIQGALNE
jgi:hypothetical protein